jgi:hypothetical protein
MSLTEESVCGFASQFYSFEQIQEKLETNNFLMFYRLIARIPKAFKDCLKENLLDIHFDTHDTQELDKMSLTEESVCGFASLRQSKTSLQKGFFNLTEISLRFSFCRYKTLLIGQNIL